MKMGWFVTPVQYPLNPWVQLYAIRRGVGRPLMTSANSGSGIQREQTMKKLLEKALGPTYLKVEDISGES